MPKSAVEICKLIGFDAYESVCITKGKIDERISKKRVAYGCLSEEDSSGFLLRTKERRVAVARGRFLRASSLDKTATVPG